MRCQKCRGLFNGYTDGSTSQHAAVLHCETTRLKWGRTQQPHKHLQPHNLTTSRPHNLTTSQYHNLAVLVALKFLADSGAKIAEVSAAFQDVASEVTSGSIRTPDHADALSEGSCKESREISVDNKAIDDEAIDIEETQQIAEPAKEANLFGKWALRGTMSKGIPEL